MIWIQRLLPGALAAGFTIATLLNVCALIFQCGCHSWFTGAAAHCNIHLANSRHCPWCTMGTALFWSIVAAISVSQFAAALLFKSGFAGKLALALSVGLLLSGLFGSVAGLRDGYWN